MITILKLTRMRRGFQAIDVAKAAGCSKSYYSRIENEAKVPNVEIAEKIANFFGQDVTEHQILFPKRYMQPDPAEKA